ncbi:MAG: phasin family protein [Janthinobacterium lividum]
MKSAEQFLSFGQGNIEAMVKSSQIVATGLQDLGKQMAANAQSAMDDSMSTFRAMSSVRSIKEAFEMQANFARSSVEKVMTQTGQFTEASMKLAGQAFEPIAGRVNVAVSGFSA